MYGSYWSVTKYKDIMHVETHHQLYSSEASLGGIRSPIVRRTSVAAVSSRPIRRITTSSARWSAPSLRR